MYGYAAIRDERPEPKTKREASQIIYERICETLLKYERSYAVLNPRWIHVPFTKKELHHIQELCVEAMGEDKPEKELEVMIYGK